jgi:hypothetical protein
MDLRTQWGGNLLRSSHIIHRGQLDQDAQAACYRTPTSVENIFWPEGQAPQGTYTAPVKLWASCEPSVAQWTLRATVNGQIVLNESGNASFAQYTFENNPQLTIEHLEFTQVVQDETNSVSLIANRPTFLRVYLSCTENCPQTGITGRIVGANGEVLLRSHGRAITVQEVNDWRDLRESVGRTLNFVFPSNWWSGTFTLNLEVIGEDENTPLATKSEVVTFTPSPNLQVVYVPVKYQNNMGSNAGSDFARQIFPIANFSYFGAPSFEWSNYFGESDCGSRTEEDRQSAAMFAYLGTYQAYLEQYNITADSDFIFAWLPAGTYGGGRAAGVGGGSIAAFGDESPDGQRTFAHEIGHLLGQRHTSTQGSRSGTCPSGYDAASPWHALYRNSRIQDYGVADTFPTGGLKKPDDNYDFMSYCGSVAGGDVWISGFI